VSSYNLLIEKWIPCRTLKGKIQIFSIKDVISNAHEIQDFSDSNPLVNGSLYRIFIAIMYRALKGPTNQDEWLELWNDGRFEGKYQKEFNEYFETTEDRFYLFDEKHPFYQVPGLESKKPLSSAKLAIFYAAGANKTLFDHHFDDNPPALSFDLAARFLIAYMNFSVGGLVSNYVRNGKKGSSRSAKASPLSRAALIILQDKNLFRNLLLNTVIYSDPDKLKSDLPAWERDEIVEPAERIPTGWIDHLTWQSKSIRLIEAQECVKNVIIADGYKLPKGLHRRLFEIMVAFNESKRKGKSDPFPAIEFDDNKVIWRNFNSLLNTIHNPNGAKNIGQLSKITSRISNKDENQLTPMTLIGIISDQAKYKYIRQESFPLDPKILEKEEFHANLNEILNIAERGGKALHRAVFDFFRTVDPNFSTKQDLKRDDFDEINKSVKNSNIENAYWGRIEHGFRRKMFELSKDPENEEIIEEWDRFIQKEIFSRLEDLYSAFMKNANTLKAISKSNGTLRSVWNAA